jgi:hypothetical protein
MPNDAGLRSIIRRVKPRPIKTARGHSPNALTAALRGLAGADDVLVEEWAVALLTSGKEANSTDLQRTETPNR